MGHVRRVRALELLLLAVLAGEKLLLYDERAVIRDYHVRWIPFDHIGGEMVFWLPFSLVDDLNHFRSYKIVRKIHINPKLVTLALHRLLNVEGSSLGSSEVIV